MDPLVVFGILLLAAALVSVGGVRMWIAHQREMADRLDGMTHLRSLAKEAGKRGRHRRRESTSEPQPEPESIETAEPRAESAADEVSDPEQTQKIVPVSPPARESARWPAAGDLHVSR